MGHVCAWCGEPATHDAVEVTPAVLRKGKAVRDEQGKSLGRKEELVKAAVVVPLCGEHKAIRDRDYAAKQKAKDERRSRAAKKAWETRRYREAHISLDDVA